MTLVSVQVHVLVGSGRLTDSVGPIRASVEGAASLAGAQLPLADVDIVVRDSPHAVIPEIGVGGFAADAHTVLVTVDAARLGDELLEYHLPGTVAHELHHAARHRDPGYGITLFEAMVTEGLAEHFEAQLLDHPPGPWATAIPDEQIPALKAHAATQLDRTPYEHPAWFFGTEPDRIPRWAGYSLGWRIVEPVLAARGVTAAALVTEPAARFSDAWDAL